MDYRAVIFDLGGVVLGSPLQAIAAFEAECGVERGFVGRVIAAGGESGAWSRLERGELSAADFHAEFGRECDRAGARLDTHAMFDRIAEASQPNGPMLNAIARIRERGLLAAALTNNWASEETESAQLLATHFDALFESSALGMRKPDPRIYRHVCSELAVQFHEAIFLDDIGQNLKSARALGMYTIRVHEPEAALHELADVLGFSLA